MTNEHVTDYGIPEGQLDIFDILNEVETTENEPKTTPHEKPQKPEFERLTASVTKTLGTISKATGDEIRSDKGTPAYLVDYFDDSQKWRLAYVVATSESEAREEFEKDPEHRGHIYIKATPSRRSYEELLALKA